MSFGGGAALVGGNQVADPNYTGPPIPGAGPPGPTSSGTGPRVGLPGADIVYDPVTRQFGVREGEVIIFPQAPVVGGGISLPGSYEVLPDRTRGGTIRHERKRVRDTQAGGVDDVVT